MMIREMAKSYAPSDCASDYTDMLVKKRENERSYFKRASPATNPSKLNFYGSSDDNDIIFWLCLLGHDEDSLNFWSTQCHVA